MIPIEEWLQDAQALPVGRSERVYHGAEHRQFQLTAARRRLAAGKLAHIKPTIVSTHSRPKAAGAYRAAYNAERMFQLTAARRRLGVTL